MLLKNLKQQMLLPKEEYIINQRVNIRGLDVLLLSFTIDKDKNRMWMMYENKELLKDNFDNEYRKEFMTNRERLLHSLEWNSRDKNFYIREMEIQGQTVRFGSSISGPIDDMNKERLMQLQHFTENGLIFDEWDDAKLESLVIAEYTQRDGDVAPSISSAEELSVVLHISKSSREVAIQRPFKVKFGKQKVGTKVTYYDDTLGTDNYFFINEICSYDIYEDVVKKAEQIEDTNTREKMLKHFNEAMESICPRDKKLLVIRYETVDNIQLKFMMRNYLEAKPVYNSSASAIGFIGKSDETGINGYKLRECMLRPVDKDFDGELEVELFTRFLEIPEEIVGSFVRKE
ncbi:hypothetical protein R9X47_28290 [Wukongibacter baidiensis]|uniref:hypothetical protein n=1 Tax=Wukongibacter baidiensis TaxID=1723361 RepID=UPI003D7FC041